MREVCAPGATEVLILVICGVTYVRKCAMTHTTAQRDCPSVGIAIGRGSRRTCGETSQSMNRDTRTHWSTFVLRTPVFALGAARRAHGPQTNSGGREASAGSSLRVVYFFGFSTG